MIRQEENFFAKKGADILMKLSKRKKSFIKHNISGNIHTPGIRFKALKTFVHTAISKKNTPNRPKRKFSGIIWSKVRPACAPKDA
jgi:hypothetical protein